MRDFQTKADFPGTPSTLTAAEFNEYILELENAVTESGQSLVQADPKQLSKSMRRIGSFDNITSVLSIDWVAASAGHPVSIKVASYHPSWAGAAAGPFGGGHFVWDSSKPKSAHNGGMVISPTVPWDGTQGSLSAFLAGTGETNPGGNGCFIRLAGPPTNVDWFGARGDGTTNDNASVNKAVASGAKGLVFSGRTYLISGISFTTGDSVTGVHFEPGARLLVQSASGAVGFSIQKQVFKVTGVLDVKSTGTISDGNTTVGIRHGTPSAGQAYLQIEAIRAENFSARGFVSFAPVYVHVGRQDSYACGYGFSIEKAGAATGTTIQLGRSYHTGCLRGVNLDSPSWVELDMPITENCGSDTTIDGALHFIKVARCIVYNRYGEINKRNIVRDDSTPIFIGGGMFAATAADNITYTGVAAADRGTVQIDGNIIRARKIDHDLMDNADLAIGTNLVVPAAGGSVKWGDITTETIKSTVASGVWTTMKVLSGQSGAGQLRVSYRYAVYAGQADLTTGYDTGVILNGVIYSDSGTVPAWLRISGSDFQINITSSSYGLSFGLSLVTVNAIL